jgi:hypothetical protein
MENDLRFFKTVNRFPKLNSSFLHARLISDCHNLAIVDRRNPTSAGVRRHLVAGTLLAPEFGHRRRMSAKPVKSGQNGRDPTGSGRIRPLI